MSALMAVWKGVGADLVLAARSFGSGRCWLGGLRYLLETRAQDEKGGPDASTDADILRARRSCPPVVAAGRSGRPEQTKSPAQSRVVHAQSAGAFRLA